SIDRWIRHRRALQRQTCLPNKSQKNLQPPVNPLLIRDPGPERGLKPYPDASPVVPIQGYDLRYGLFLGVEEAEGPKGGPHVQLAFRRPRDLDIDAVDLAAIAHQRAEAPWNPADNVMGRGLDQVELGIRKGGLRLQQRRGRVHQAHNIRDVDPVGVTLQEL